MSVSLPTKKRGDTWLFSFQWKINNSIPVDLSDCTGRMMVRLNSNPSTKASADDIIIIPETGIVNVRFNANTTSQLPAGIYLTDLELTFGDGTVQSSDTYLLNVTLDQTY